MRLAWAISLLLVWPAGCGKLKIAPRDPSAPPPSSNAEHMAQVCSSKSSKPIQAACVEAWARKHPDRSIVLASRLFEGSKMVPPSPELAFVALQAAPENERAAHLLADVVGVALAKGNVEVAGDALDALEHNAQHRKDAELAAAIIPLQAEVDRRRGRWEDAAASYAVLVESSPVPEDDVAAVVEMLVRAGKTADVGSFCGGLVADDARIQQSLVCLREAVDGKAMKAEDAYPIALERLAHIPGLRPDELRRLAPPGLPMLTTVAECEQGLRVPPERVLGNSVFGSDPQAGPESAVYSSLAAAESDRGIRYCYQSLAAQTCAASVGTATSCSDPRSIAHYIQAAAREDPYAIEAISVGIAGIMRTKGELYRGRRRPREIDPYAFVQLRELEGMTLALFEIHMVLAYTFYDNPELARPQGIYSVRWHIKLAMDRWHELEPERRFPSEMLDEAMLNEEVDGVSLRDYIQRREPVAAPAAASPSP